MRKITEYLAKLVMGKFYGEITLKFEAGVIVHVKETKSYSKEQFS